MSRLLSFDRSRPAPVTVIIFGAVTLLAWYNRFILDDAFISFRYAYNLAQGQGLVWNAGERVEGYSNFLWTVVFSLPIGLGLDPVRVSHIFGIVLFLLTAIFIYRLARLTIGSVGGARLTVLLLGTNYTFSSYATGGLETQLQACLFVACVYLATRLTQTNQGRGGTAAVLSLLLALSVLTRPDSLLVAAVILPLLAYVIVRDREKNRRHQAWTFAELSGLFLPFVFLVGAWLIWKTRYYGDILPNTYYVKLGSSPSLRQGLVYLYDFFVAYWLAPAVLLFLWASPRLFATLHRPLLLPLLITVLWLIYTTFAGGDFMEFRFLVPVLPFLYLQLVWAIMFIRSRTLRAALIAVLAIGSFYHARTFTHRDGIEGIELLQSHIDGPRDNWRGIGRVLGAEFGNDTGVIIATTAAGAIPFYSRLTTVDMHGLNDGWVARNGMLMGSRPGHQRLASLAYMIEKRVNLLIGHPLVVDAGTPITNSADSQEFAIHFFFRLPGQDQLPEASRLLEIPLDSSHNLLVLYVVSHERVDQAIRANGWRTFPVVPRSRR